MYLPGQSWREPKKHRFLQHAPKSLFPQKDASTYSQILSALLQVFIPISSNHCLTKKKVVQTSYTERLLAIPQACTTADWNSNVFHLHFYLKSESSPKQNESNALSCLALHISTRTTNNSLNISKQNKRNHHMKGNMRCRELVRPYICQRIQLFWRRGALTSRIPNQGNLYFTCNQTLNFGKGENKKIKKARPSQFKPKFYIP